MDNKLTAEDFVKYQQKLSLQSIKSPFRPFCFVSAKRAFLNEEFYTHFFKSLKKLFLNF